jgi:hypothetical protein
MPVSGAMAPAPAVEQRHSVLGIVALCLAVCGALGLFALISVAVLADAFGKAGESLIADDSAGEALLGLGLFGAVGLELLALGVSFGALFEKERKRVLAIVAMAISFMSLAGSGLLILIGALAD